MAANSDAEKSRFRWLDAARYAVAAVVTVVIVAVIANAIKVVLRPETMYVSVLGGSVFSQRIIPDGRMKFDTNPPDGRMINLDIKVRSQNPSGRAVMYYENITGYLFDKNTPESSSDPEDDSILFFPMEDIALLQGKLVDSLMHASNVTEYQIDPTYFDMMYSNNGSTISDVTLRLDGKLITEAPAGNNRSRPTTYYCRQLLVGGELGDKAFESKPDVPCSDVQRSRHVLLWLSMLACMVALILTL